MVDAARPAPIPQTAPQRRRNPLVWIVAAVVAFAGIALIAHGAVRELTEVFRRPATSPHTTAAPALAPVARDAAAPGSGPLLVKAGASPAPSTVDAPASETAPAIEPPPVPAPIPIPSASPAVGAPPIVAAPARPSAIRGAAASSPTAGPAHSVAAPTARPVVRPLVARPIAPAWVEPPQRTPRQNGGMRGNNGVWIEEPPASIDDGPVGPRRRDFPVRPSGRPWQNHPIAPRPFPTRPNEYPRSANPY